MTSPPAPVHLERDGDVAVVVLDNPPLNMFDEPVFDEQRPRSAQRAVNRS